MKKTSILILFLSAITLQVQSQALIAVNPSTLSSYLNFSVGIPVTSHGTKTKEKSE